MGLISCLHYTDERKLMEKITITKTRYNELLDSEFKLNCLENGGVSSWDWYDDSLKDGGYYTDDEDEE